MVFSGVWGVGGWVGGLGEINDKDYLNLAKTEHWRICRKIWIEITKLDGAPK